MVAQRDEGPMAIPATLISEEPLMVTVAEDPNLKRGEAVLVLGQQATTVVRAEGSIASSARTGSQWAIEIDGGQWEFANRRRADRYEVEVPASLFAVQDEGESATLIPFEGDFRELSKTGGWIQSETLLPKGSLVQWNFTVHGASVRGLGLVIRSCPVRGGMALEFVQFTGSAYAMLTRFLEDQAA